MLQAAMCERIKAVATAAPLAGILLVEAVGGAGGVSGTNDASQVFVESAGHRPGARSGETRLDCSSSATGPSATSRHVAGRLSAGENIPQRSPCLG